MENLRGFSVEINDLVEALSQARIPYNSYDKEKIGNDEADYLEDMGFINKIDNLQAYLYNIEDSNDDPAILLKNYSSIKDEIKYIQDRFNSAGYLSDRNKGGDMLKNDFPEIAEKINSLMTEMSELDVITASLGNRLSAQEKFKELSNTRSGLGEYISKINYISKNGNLGFNSLNIGTFHSKEELVVKLEKFLNEDLKNSISEIKENDNFSEEEKENRLAAVQGLIVGGQEYLDEFKSLMESRNE